MINATLIDSNILIYLVNLDDPKHLSAQKIVKRVFDGQLTGLVTPQIYQEFAAVVSDSRRTQNPLASHDVRRYINLFTKVFHLIVPTRATLDIWVQMIADYHILRQKVFDAFLVATAYENNISTIYTENINDFRIYPNIEIVNPL